MKIGQREAEERNWHSGAGVMSGGKSWEEYRQKTYTTGESDDKMRREAST